MKLILGVLVVLTCFSGMITAQNVKLTGRVIDKVNAQPIEYANIALLKQDSTFVAGISSDVDGSFAFNHPVGNYLVSISYMGYRTAYTRIGNLTENKDLGNISIEPSGVVLQGVTVTAQSVINKADRKLITPSGEQVKTSANAFDLLKKLQLPRIEVNPLTNAISVTGNGEVQLRINGVKVTNADVQSLRPEDIIRIEFHDDPGVRYGNAAAVIDYITRRSISGGNVNGDFMNNLSDGIGFAEDNFSAKYNNKKSEFAVNSYYTYRNIDWVQANNESFVFPDKIINREEVGEPTLYKERSLKTSFNYSLMDKDNYFLNATFRYNYSDEPNMYSDRNSRLYTSENNIPLIIKDHSTETTKSPALDLYFQKNLKNDQLLIFNVVGTYIDAHNTRLYQEHREKVASTDIFSDISGNKYSLIAEGIYERKLGEGKLTAGAKHIQTYSENSYKGTTVADISMRQSETYAYGEYQLKKGKFSYMVNLTGVRFYYSQAGQKQEKYTLQPSARITYNPNDDLYFRYRFGIWNDTPSLSDLNNVTQAIDSIQIRRGNPNLRSSRSYNHTFTSGYNKGIFGVELYSRYKYSSKPVMESVLFENGVFVRTNQNQRSHQHMQAQLSLKLKPLKDHLTITFAPGINHYISKGETYTHRYTNRFFRISVDGSFKNFIGTFNYYAPWDYFYGESLNNGERLHMAGIGYNKPKWSVMLGAFNPFGGTYKRNNENWSELNPVKSKISTENLVRMYTIKVTFNLDFGRKFSGGDKRINNSDTDSGIMSGAKK